MKNVEFIKLDMVKKDERGSIFQFENRNSSKLLLIKRKQGTISGGHYHTGLEKMKNPEILIILDGKFEIFLKNIKTSEEFRKVYNYPIMFKIDPYIYHEIKAIGDIILLDMNSIGTVAN